jgi:hypothetical protein
MDPQEDVLNELKNNMSQRMGQRLAPPPEAPPEEGMEGEMPGMPAMPSMPGMDGAPAQNVNQQDPSFSANGALPKNILGRNPNEPGVEFSDDEMSEFAGLDDQALGMI